MANYRRDRINGQMCCEMAEIIREIKDPRVSRYLVTVTGCDVTADLKYAKIYYSVIVGKGHTVDHKALKAGLYSACGYIRGRLAKTMNLRITPELTFIEDESAQHGARINALLHDVQADLERFRADEEQRAAESEGAEETEERESGEENDD